MIVLRPDSGITDETSAGSFIQNLLGSKARIQSITFIGKKALAYEIDKISEGLYVLAKLSAEKLLTGDIDKKIKLEPKVMRYLLTTLEE